MIDLSDYKFLGNQKTMVCIWCHEVVTMIQPDDTLSDIWNTADIHAGDCPQKDNPER